MGLGAQAPPPQKKKILVIAPNRVQPVIQYYVSNFLNAIFQAQNVRKSIHSAPQSGT